MHACVARTQNERGGTVPVATVELSMTTLNDQVVDIIRRKAYLRLDEPVQLASGKLSSDFVDVKAGLAEGADLRLVCEAMIERLAGIDYDAIGGLTMGADQFAHGVAVLSGASWFVVRKEPKGRGTNKLVEGTAIGPGSRVVLVEDTVSTGGSIVKAHEVVTGLGAKVAAAVTVVDRGDSAAAYFAQRAIPYLALVTYRDLEIESLTA
jgi:orotate phosphoribosyltransferase